MGLIAAKCSQCGADIEIDDSQEYGYCSHCGTKFITEKIIHNTYNIVNHNTKVENATIIQRASGLDDKIERFKYYIVIDDLDKAFEEARSMLNDYPYKAESHLFLSLIHAKLASSLFSSASKNMESYEIVNKSDYLYIKSFLAKGERQSYEDDFYHDLTVMKESESLSFDDWYHLTKCISKIKPLDSDDIKENLKKDVNLNVKMMNNQNICFPFNAATIGLETAIKEYNLSKKLGINLDSELNETEKSINDTIQIQKKTQDQLKIAITKSLDTKLAAYDKALKREQYDASERKSLSKKALIAIGVAILIFAIFMFALLFSKYNSN